MARTKGSGTMGPTRSTRLPIPLDEWFAARLSLRPEASASELLVSLIHGGLRLREGYMAVHRRQLERYALRDERAEFDTYADCLLDTFGRQYLDHLMRWLQADGMTSCDPIPEAARTR